MAQQVQGQFGYQTVQLIKTKPLGTGSYGAVYKAKCDDLPCAAKILHPTLFQFNDPGAMTVMRRFEQECNFLSAIRHPNIVQYLGSYRDPETRLPVLLMELMDKSLTRFLERSQEPLPYHTQVDLCHDIALALAYLHSMNIVHRDLSSNNVLLIGAGYRAKVTDFGMAKLFDVNRATLTPLTMCPGTLAYMSPEALDDPPVYTKKLDCFSFGALDIQIVTRQFPDPGPRTKKIQDPRYPLGQNPVPETERRKSHIDQISPTHPLLPIATDCLSYNEDDRPSAQELCHCLAALKETPQYGGSVRRDEETNTPAPSTTADREGGERQIRELQQQQEVNNQQIQDLQQQLQNSDGQLREKDVVLVLRQRENQALHEEIRTTRRQYRELLAANSIEVERLKQNCELIQEELTSVRATLTQTEGVRETLAGKLEEKVFLEDVVKERGERIVQLEYQLQVVRESEQRLMEKLDRERVQIHELLAARSDSAGQLLVLQQRIKEQQDELGAVSQELEDTRRQLKIREAQVEDLEQLASARNDDIERLNEELHQVTQQLGEQRVVVSDLQSSAAEHQTQLEKVQQDLCAAQENVVVLVGARNLPDEHQLPANVVDRSVHDSLQQAYKNMEEYYVRVNGQLQSAQETIQVLVGKNNELVARVEQCRKEFEAKAPECVELQRQLRNGGGGEVGDEVGALRQRVRELEEGQEEVEQSCAIAVEELTARQEECKQQQERIVELEQKLGQLQRNGGGGEVGDKVGALRQRVRELEEGQEEVEQSCAIAVQELTARQEECKQQQERIVELEQKLGQLQRDYEELEDKYDNKLHEKNDTLEHQQIALDEKVAEVSAVREEKARLAADLQRLQEEKGKLERTVHMLRRQIDATRAARKAKEEGMRTCPVCDTTLSARIAQADFERHVQGHFDQN